MIRVSPLKVGQSRWVVCSGNPINRIDPEGLDDLGQLLPHTNQKGYGDPTWGEVGGTALMVYGAFGLARTGLGILGHTLNRYGAAHIGTELVVVAEGTSVTTSTVATGTGAAAAGTRNTRVRAAVYNGNEMHYDKLNGGRGYAGSGVGAPAQLQNRFPQTRFRFAPRGAAGADVEVIGGRHPSSYPGSTWPKGANIADFKPYTQSGLNAVSREIRAGKLPPGTVPIYYEPFNGVLRTP